MYTQRTGKYDKVDAYEDNDMLKGLFEVRHLLPVYGKIMSKKWQQIAIKHFTIILKEKLLMKNKLSFISIFTLCIALSLTACGVKQASTRCV